jgi:hypothetical protein
MATKLSTLFTLHRKTGFFPDKTKRTYGKLLQSIHLLPKSIQLLPLGCRWRTHPNRFEGNSSASNRATVSGLSLKSGHYKKNATCFDSMKMATINCSRLARYLLVDNSSALKNRIPGVLNCPLSKSTGFILGAGGLIIMGIGLEPVFQFHSKMINFNHFVITRGFNHFHQ